MMPLSGFRWPASIVSGLIRDENALKYIAEF